MKIINPFYIIRFLLYFIFRIQSVRVLNSKGNVSWYYVRNNGFYEYIYKMSGNSKYKLLDNGKLYDTEYKYITGLLVEWKPLFTFWNK